MAGKVTLRVHCTKAKLQENSGSWARGQRQSNTQIAIKIKRSRRPHTVHRWGKATIEAARAGGSGKGFCGGEVACRSNRKGNRRDCRTDRLDPVGRRRCTAGDRAGRCHRPRNVGNCHAATVDKRNSAAASIAEGVSRASDEARIGAEAMSRVADVTAEARSTASGVKDLPDSEAESLEDQVRQFLSSVQAALLGCRACKAAPDRRFEIDAACGSISCEFLSGHCKSQTTLFAVSSRTTAGRSRVTSRCPR